MCVALALTVDLASLVFIHTAVWRPESEDQDSDLPFPALWPQALHPPAWRRRPRPSPGWEAVGDSSHRGVKGQRDALEGDEVG